MICFYHFCNMMDLNWITCSKRNKTLYRNINKEKHNSPPLFIPFNREDKALWYSGKNIKLEISLWILGLNLQLRACEIQDKSLQLFGDSCPSM